MRFTENYKLASVVPSEPLNPLEDSRRMLTIDRQLLGLFEVFGNGVIDGWDVVKAGGLDVSVTPGHGHINYVSAMTATPRTVTCVRNSTNWIYARLSEDAPYTRNVVFFASAAPIASVDVIPLAMVGAGLATISTIDTSIRVDISFIEAIKTLIAQHKHKGGADNPSRVDLLTEVQGQLPGYRIDGLDASKIVSGRIPASRMPAIEHGDLLHSGVLTHAQLDSFVRDLTNPNTRLLGELSAVNMMQLYLAHKHIWNDVDLETTDLLVMVPGITNDAFTDYPHTTAMVDKYNHTIQGIPALPGRLHTVTFRTESDFFNAFARVNLDISSDHSGAMLTLTRPVSEVIVEGFDNVFANDTPIPNWTLSTLSSIVYSNNSKFVSDSAKRVEGAYSAKLHIDQQMTIQVQRIFDKTQDWTPFNEIDTLVETLNLEHGQVRMQILGKKSGDTYEVLDDFMLLNQNETTKDFKNVARDISSLTRDTVNGLRIYTDTSLGWNPNVINDVNIDTIRVVNNLYYDPSGFIRFRLQTPQKSHWAAIAWDGVDNGGQIVARARSAPNYAIFDRSIAVPFGPTITVSGDDPKIADNTNVEIEVALSSNPAKTATPVVRSVTLSYITQSQDEGITINSAAEFLRGTKFSNTKVLSFPGQILPDGQEDGSVVIDGRNDTGDVCYGLMNSVQQMTFDSNATPVLGFTGTGIFTSPWQAATKDLFQILVKRKAGFDGVAHVYRQEDRTYLMCDTFNDRVMLLDKNGDLIKGLVTNNIHNESDLYPISAIFNIRLKTLYVAWSTNVSNDAKLDLTQFQINGTGLIVNLNQASDKPSSISGLPADQGKTSGNVLAIALGDAHFGEIMTYLENQGEDASLYLDVGTNAVPNGVDKSNSNYASLAGPKGLPIFVSDVRYVPGLFRPISITLGGTGNWIVCNAKPLSTTTEGADVVTGMGKTSITSVIEVVPDTGEIVFSDNSLDFSIITLGSAIEMNDRYIAVAGITQDPFPVPTTAIAATTTQTLDGGTVQTNTTTTTTNTTTAGGVTTAVAAEIKTDYGEIGKYRGRVRIVEKKSGRVVFDQPTSDGTYGSDVQIDADGNLVVVEKFFLTGNTQTVIPIGRGRVVKMDEDGNIFYQYGLNEYEAFNDARILDNGHIMVSS